MWLFNGTITFPSGLTLLTPHIDKATILWPVSLPIVISIWEWVFANKFHYGVSTFFELLTFSRTSESHTTLNRFDERQPHSEHHNIYLEGDIDFNIKIKLTFFKCSLWFGQVWADAAPTNYIIPLIIGPPTPAPLVIVVKLKWYFLICANIIICNRLDKWVLNQKSATTAFIRDIFISTDFNRAPQTRTCSKLCVK